MIIQIFKMNISDGLKMKLMYALVLLALLACCTSLGYTVGKFECQLKSRLMTSAGCGGGGAAAAATPTTTAKRVTAADTERASPAVPVKTQNVNVKDEGKTGSARDEDGHQKTGDAGGVCANHGNDYDYTALLKQTTPSSNAKDQKKKTAPTPQPLHHIPNVVNYLQSGRTVTVTMTLPNLFQSADLLKLSGRLEQDGSISLPPCATAAKPGAEPPKRHPPIPAKSGGTPTPSPDEKCHRLGCALRSALYNEFAMVYIMMGAMWILMVMLFVLIIMIKKSEQTHTILISRPALRMFG